MSDADLVFDLETNGLLDKLDTIHCNALFDRTTREVTRANDHGAETTMEHSVGLLQEAAKITGHNIIGFDIPALQKVYPSFAPKGVIRDTLIMSRLIYADLKERDFAFAKKHSEFPKNLIGSHSLEAWGYRLGLWKGDYSKIMKEKGLDPWAEWNQEMDDYCVQDIRVTYRLLQRLEGEGFAEEAIELEHAIAPILSRQEKHGWLFDAEAAKELECTLVAKRAELAERLRAAFPPWEQKDTLFIPKRDNKRLGYTKGVPFQKWKTVVFNPASRSHIANRLIELHDWEPKEFTSSGQPKVDEGTMKGLKYPEVPLLMEYLIVGKRLGQLSEGKQAWLRVVKKDGRIHGRVNQNGAVTGRMTHSNPNVAQVPASGAKYGHECRALFTVPKGKKLVGADASGLELRCLAHYMGRWDGGDYGKVILESDIHTENQKAAGLPTRDMAKTFI